jgi:dTDP-glucose pyrophosphorylase
MKANNVPPSDVCVREDASLAECARVLRQGGALVALVVDETGRLLGSITDGDIRRALLVGTNMEEPAQAAMNPAPISAPLDTPRSKCLNLMRRQSIFQLPLIDEAGVIRDLVLLSEGAANANRPNRVVIMAGGLGTRLGPLTEKTPKPMLMVGGRPMLQGIVERLIAKGFWRISISVNYLAEQIEKHFGDGSLLGVEIDYLRESKRLGTAGCLSLLSHAPQEPILMINGDVVSDIDLPAMLRFHDETGAAGTMALNNYKVDIPYGVVETDGHEITGLREKPSYSFFVSAGAYILSPAAVTLVPKDTFYDMPTLFEELRRRGGVISGFPLHEYWLDVGRPNDLDNANALYGEIFAETEKQA